MFGAQITQTIPALNGTLTAKYHYGISLLDDDFVVPQDGHDLIWSGEESFCPGFLVVFSEPGGEEYPLIGVQAATVPARRSLEVIRFNNIDDAADYTKNMFFLPEDERRSRGRKPPKNDGQLYFEMPTFRVLLNRIINGFTLFVIYKYKAPAASSGVYKSEEVARVVFQDGCLRSGIFTVNEDGITPYRCFGLEVPD